MINYYRPFKTYRLLLNRFGVNELKREKRRLERFIEIINEELKKRNQ